MNKETFEKKWYFQWLHALYWGTLIFFSVTLIWMGLIGSDVEAAGVFWAGVVAGIYWLIKRTFYCLVLGEKFLPRKPR